MKKIVVCVVAMLLVVVSMLIGIGGQAAWAEPIAWSTTGPVGYLTVQSLVMVGTTLYAGGADGRVFSRTGPSGWIDTGLRASSTIFDLAWNGTDTLYAGCSNGHVYSRTGAGSWTDMGRPGDSVRTLAWNGSDTLYAGDNSGHVWCWTPGGSWASYGMPDDPYNTSIDCLAWNGSDTLYASSSYLHGRVWARTEGSPSWTDYGDPTGDGYINCLAWNGTDTLYAACGYGRVASRTDGGPWNDLGATGGTYTYSLALSGTTIYAGDFNGHVYSKTGADSWTDLGNTNLGSPENYVWAVVLDGANTVYAGCRDGRVYSKTGAGSWIDTTCKGAASTESLAWNGSNTIYSGSGDGRVYSKTGAGPWTNTGDLGTSPPSSIYALAWDGTDTLYAGRANGDVYSKAGAGPWVDTNLTEGWTVNSLAWDGTDTLYAGCDDGNVYSRTGSSAWADTELNEGTAVNTLVWDGTDTVYAGCTDGTILSKTPGNPWANTGSPGGFSHVYSLAWNGSNTLYAGFSNGHVYSKTGAEGWTNTGEAGISNINGLMCIGGSVYAASSDGHIYTRSAAGPWTDTGDTGLNVLCLAYNGTDTMYAGCYTGVLSGEPNPAGTHTITASAGANGSINPRGTVTVYDGDDRTFTITPAAHYHISTVTVDGAPVTPAPTYTFNNVTANHTINATFAADPSQNATWYLAEGSTDWGYSCYISIENPNTSTARCAITYMTRTGPVSGGTLTLPPSSQATVFPKDVIGATDFSTRVVSVDGKAIAVDRTMTWTGPGCSSEESHTAVGVTSPNRTWYLAEGSSAWGFECWLLIQNPNAKTANCQVTYMIEGEGPRTFNKKVEGNSRATFNMAEDIGARDASIKVTADTTVIPERAMYRDSRREGHDSTGTVAPATDYYLAEGTTAWGFTDYVLVQNPNDTAVDVTTTYMTPSGPVTPPAFSMPANSRKTIRVNDIPAVSNTDLSTKVHGSKPIIAERAMYWKGGPDSGEACHDSIGMDKAHMTFFLPDGQTTDGRETWTLVQNPNSATITVEITYMTPDGKGNIVKTEKMPANSRRTFNMREHSGLNGRAAIMVTSKTGGKPIIVERAMYWNNRGAGTDTIGGYSD